MQRWMGIVIGLAVVLIIFLRAAFPDSGQDELNQVRAATSRFHRPEAALAAGYALVPGLDDCFSIPTIGGIGVHLINRERLDLDLDAREPEALVYQAGPNTMLRLGAVAYLVPAAKWDAAGHTQPPSILGQRMHRSYALGAYVLRAWVWQENQLGMFEDANPQAFCAPGTSDAGVHGGNFFLRHAR